MLYHEKDYFAVFRRYVHEHACQEDAVTAAKAENYECEIAAYSMSEAKEKASDADVILLGPQVRFNKGKIEELCPGIPVDAIDMKLYGRMDGKGVVAVAKKMLGD